MAAETQERHLRPRLAQIVGNGLLAEAYERGGKEEAMAEWNHGTLRREPPIRGYKRWRCEQACICMCVKGLQLVDGLSWRK